MKTSEDRHTFFLETFRLIHTDRRKYTYRLDGHHFSIPEKRLLRAFLEFYRNHKDKSLELLRTSPISDPFLEGVRLYLIGLVYNQNSHFRYAIENLEKSVRALNSTNHHGFIINPVSLLIITHSNRKEIRQMGTWIKELRKVKPETGIAHLMVYHCEILFAAMNGDSKTTEKLLKDVAEKNFEEYPSFLPHFQVIHMTLLIREKRYEECLLVLNEYKKTAENAIVKANYAFIKSMTEHLYRGKPLYVFSERFKEFPELLEQLEVIKNLSSGNLTDAKKYWLKLQKHNPDLYLDGFRFSGDECLFSQALEKYSDFTIETNWDQTRIRSFSSKIDRLDYLLTHAKEPLQAELLVKLIWEEESTLQNLARLRKLVSMYSKKKGIKVISNRQSYRIEKKAGSILT